MPDNTNDSNDDVKVTQETQDTTSSANVDLTRMRVEDMTPEQVREALLLTRGEAKTRRKTAAELQEELRGRDTELATMRAAQEQQLREQGDYKTLAEQQAIDLAKMSTLEQEAKRYREAVQASNEKRIEQLPEHMRDVVPDLVPDAMSDWLDRALPKLTAAPIPNLDGGAGGYGRTPGGSSTKLTDEEKIVAARMHMTHEQYAAKKEK